MSRYGPRVLPQYQGGDPGQGIVDAAEMFAQMRRQGRLDEERATEAERARQDREYRLYGQQVRDRPPAEMPEREIRPMDNAATAETFTGLMPPSRRGGGAGEGLSPEGIDFPAVVDHLRSEGFQRPEPEPPPVHPGTFDPRTRKFNLRYNGARPQQAARSPSPEAAGTNPGGMTPLPYPTPNLGERRAPRYEQIGEGRYIDPSLTWEGREAAREAEQIAAIEEAFGLLQDDDPTNDAGAMSYLVNKNVPGHVLDRIAPRDPDESTVNWQRFTGEDGKLYQLHPRTGEVRPVQGPDGRPLRGPRGGDSLSPTEARLTEQNQRSTALQLTEAWLDSGLTTAQIHQRLQQRNLGGVLDPTEIHGRYMRRHNKRYEGEENESAEDKFYRNVTKLVPPTSPAEEFAARNIATNKPPPQSEEYLMESGWTEAEAGAIMRYYEAVEYAR